MKQLSHKLQKLGLSEKEADVYLATLESAFGISIANIAKKTNIKRSTVYLALEELKRRGLISISRQGGHHVYMAEDPRVFEEKIKEQSLYLRELLPELLSVTNVLARKPQIRFYEGLEGIKDVYRDTLSYNKSEILAWATGDINEELSKWLNANYLPARIAARIPARVLAVDTSSLRELAGDNIASLRNLRLITKNTAPFSVEVNLYGGRKMALVSFREEFGVIIESKEIFETFKAIFEGAWDANEKTSAV